MGWQAELRLQFGLHASRTVLAGRSHTGPLVVQRAFHPEGDVCHLYIVHPPGGVVGGDRLTLLAQAPAGTQALLTTPAAGKFYRSAGQTARLEQTLNVDEGSVEWLPQENIFYPQCRARLQTRVLLTGGARFIGWELGCFGFPATSAAFDEGRVHQDLELWHDGHPVLVERLRLQAESGVFRERWGLAGRHTLGTMLAFPCRREHLAAARGAIPAETAREVNLACSLVDGLLICRATHARAECIKSIFVTIWRGLRPALLGREAHLPRIWAT